jgi:predicted nucleic acid-binding protein
MKFWDTSAVVPLLLDEEASNPAGVLRRADPMIVVSWLTIIECASAIARAEHDEMVDRHEAGAAFTRLDDLSRTWTEVEPTNDLRDIARRLLRAHRLRAGDAVQIASATLAAERRPATLEFVTLDDRLETAALKEGFMVIFPGREPPSGRRQPA